MPDSTDSKGWDKVIMNFHNKVQKWLYSQKDVSSSQHQCCVVSGFNSHCWLLTFTFVKEMVKKKIRKFIWRRHFHTTGSCLTFYNERLIFFFQRGQLPQLLPKDVPPLFYFPPFFHSNFSRDLCFPSLHQKICELKKHPCMLVSSGDCHKYVGARTRTW